MSGYCCHLCGIEILDDDGQDPTDHPAIVDIIVTPGIVGDDLPDLRVSLHAHDECAMRLVHAVVPEGNRPPLLPPDPTAF